MNTQPHTGQCTRMHMHVCVRACFRTQTRWNYLCSMPLSQTRSELHCFRAHTQAHREAEVAKTFDILQSLQNYVETCLANVEEATSTLSPGNPSCCTSAERKRKRPSGSGEVKQQLDKQFEDHMLPGTPTQVSVSDARVCVCVNSAWC